MKKVLEWTQKDGSIWGRETKDFEERKKYILIGKIEKYKDNGKQI